MVKPDHSSVWTGVLANRKLPRVCRSSLSAEAQACANAVDRLGRCVNLLVVGILAPQLQVGSPEAYDFLPRHVVVKDCRGLYDASQLRTAGLGIQDKRTAIEVMTINERMAAIRAGWRWTSADQQLSDGLTKVQTRQVLEDQLRRGYHMLVFDPDAKTRRPRKRRRTPTGSRMHNDFRTVLGSGSSVSALPTRARTRPSTRAWSASFPALPHPWCAGARHHHSPQRILTTLATQANPPRRCLVMEVILVVTFGTVSSAGTWCSWVSGPHGSRVFSYRSGACANRVQDSAPATDH